MIPIDLGKMSAFQPNPMPSDGLAHMKHWIPAALLIALWVIVLAILSTPEAPAGYGLAHSKFAAMDQGGNGAARHSSLMITGWIFGGLQIAAFVALLAWVSGTKPCRADGRRTVFLLGGLIFEAVFAMMCLAYHNSLTDVEVAFIGPFPAGVSWLLFGMWIFPVFFILLYVVFFERWILPLRSVNRFAELTAPSSLQVTERDG